MREKHTPVCSYKRVQRSRLIFDRNNDNRIEPAGRMLTLPERLNTGGGQGGFDMLNLSDNVPFCPR